MRSPTCNKCEHEGITLHTNSPCTFPPQKRNPKPRDRSFLERVTTLSCSVLLTVSSLSGFEGDCIAHSPVERESYLIRFLD